MLDFLIIGIKKIKGDEYDPETGKKEVKTLICPKFKATSSKDLMIRGGDFYAIWDEANGRWSTKKGDAVRIIDNELEAYKQEHYPNRHDVCIQYLWDSDSGAIDKWNKYCKQQMWDNYTALDTTIVFSNTPVSKENYSSKSLDYPFVEGPTDAFNSLFSVLYSEEELNKLRWAIGSIVSGDSKTIQKFIVLYGDSGTGKSTILNVIQELFKGYYAVFDAKSLGKNGNDFALEAFSSNPLVAIQHDGDLSHIEDNTKLNSLVSHEQQVVNEKHKSLYSASFNAFLFMGTNKPVKITDSKSGLIRRLIDVHPTGNLVSGKDYKRLIKQIDFELGPIAYSCYNYYISHKDAYNNYVPFEMIASTNDFYNFVEDNELIFADRKYVTLAYAWEQYKKYCEMANVPYPLTRRSFREELKNYFDNFGKYTDGDTVYKDCYWGFRKYKLSNETIKPVKELDSWLSFKENIPSNFDILGADFLAQLTKDDGTPEYRWGNVHTILREIDTSLLHYVKVPVNHIVIDFDIPDENGNKSFELNYEAASKFPPTYAELSKSGSGIHLHYIYTGGDLDQLNPIYDEHIEVKVFKGNSALRRKLTFCNDLDISEISSGLPLKEKKEKSVMLDEEFVLNDKKIRTIVQKAINKEYPPGSTICNINFIKKTLEEAVEKNISYDISDLRQSVVNFASHSTHNKEYCFKVAVNLPYANGEAAIKQEEERELAFFDIESVPNLLLICYKKAGPNEPFVRLFNPTREEMDLFFSYNLAGFNNINYDDLVTYAYYQGYSVEEANQLSQDIISGLSRNLFRNKGVSYADIYDVSTRKQSIKKWEIELDLEHDEWEMDWTKPLPKELWNKFANYCCHDVAAAEAVWNTKEFQSDWEARLILAKIAGLTPIHTTNQCTTKFIFGDAKNPGDQFNYRDLSKPVRPSDEIFEKYGVDRTYRVFDEHGEPLFRDYIPGEELPEGYSILPFFPEYKYELGKSWFNDEEVGEGGRVYAEPGAYLNVGLFDIASMHPSTIIAENYFGPYTKRFAEIVQARIYVKHHDIENARKILNGALAPFLNDPTDEMLKQLAYALKIAINSVYGLTAAKFVNAFFNKNNIDNIVAKRGALFMSKLMHAVQNLGYKVAHIKTDSIKVPNFDDYIKNFIMDYGKEFGYNFEHEATYEKMCLVNNAVYIAKYDDGHWDATGKQFAVPYVFKSLFSHEEIVFDDLTEVFNVQTALYLDQNESLKNVELEEKQLNKFITIYKKGELTEEQFMEQTSDIREVIDANHLYHFIGRVGKFCPIKPGYDGGLLMRRGTPIGQIPRYSNVANTTGYRWLEAKDVLDINWIDMTYFDTQLKEAIDSISQYTERDYEQGIEWFCA